MFPNYLAIFANDKTLKVSMRYVYHTWNLMQQIKKNFEEKISKKLWKQKEKNRAK